MTASDAARFWAKVDTAGDCWLWLASMTHDGYGRFHVNGRTQRAHRVAYATLKGPIPEGLLLDHLCRVRHCVNPAHLEAVPSKDNTLRGTGLTARQAAQTHCIHGHPLSGPNLWIRPCGRRRCQECQRRSESVHRARARAA